MNNVGSKLNFEARLWTMQTFIKRAHAKKFSFKVILKAEKIVKIGYTGDVKKRFYGMNIKSTQPKSLLKNKHGNLIFLFAFLGLSEHIDRTKLL